MLSDAPSPGWGTGDGSRAEMADWENLAMLLVSKAAAAIYLDATVLSLFVVVFRFVCYFPWFLLLIGVFLSVYMYY